MFVISLPIALFSRFGCQIFLKLHDSQVLLHLSISRPWTGSPPPPASPDGFLCPENGVQLTLLQYHYFTPNIPSTKFSVKHTSNIPGHFQGLNPGPPGNYQALFLLFRVNPNYSFFFLSLNLSPVISKHSEQWMNYYTGASVLDNFQ